MVEPQLNEVEVRVLGALVEKSVTTPEYYPMSLVALVNACNQKSNRDPMTDYDARLVGETLVTLREKGLARTMMGGDSRVPKYRHYFDEMYGLNAAETAILCELMLRGPQTSGELRGRIERFEVSMTLPEVETLLAAMAERPTGPLVVQLPRQAGRRDVRYAHLLAGEPSAEVFADTPRPVSAAAPGNERLQRLEDDLATLREDFAALRAEFAAFRKQFE